MKRSQFSEEQIIGVLREQEAGMKVGAVCRKHDISEPTFYHITGRNQRAEGGADSCAREGVQFEELAASATEDELATESAVAKTTTVAWRSAAATMLCWTFAT